MTAPMHPAIAQAVVEQHHLDLRRNARPRTRHAHHRAARRERLGWLLVAYGLRLITTAG